MSELADQGGNGLRDTIEAAVASHSSSPDIESVVSGAVEQRAREIRTRSKSDRPDSHQLEAEQSDKRRQAARDAVNEAKLKAAQGPRDPAKPASIPPGPPATWDKAAQAAWHDLPQEVRLAELREHADLQTAVEPRLKAHDEIRQAFEPLKPVLQAAGITDEVQGVKALLGWESRFRNPETRMAAFHDLARQYGVDLGGMGSPMQPAPQASPEHIELASRTVSQFAQGKDHFETVRETMGLLIQRHPDKYVSGNGADLDRAYRDACRVDGIAPETTAKRASAVSPSSRAPAVQASPKASGNSVRDSIINSMREVRRAG